MVKTIKIAQEGPANALALNRYNTQVVIAGRNVFKVLNIEENEFVENCNLRVGKNLNLNFLNHVSWSVLDDALVATAATNGAVLLWNLNKPSKSKQEHVFTDHKRTVNKVTFHPTDASLLLSGSQDGTMKCFDLRKKDVVATFVSNSESVRDVQFNPHFTVSFSSVSENGNVQIWDLRRPERYTQQFAAHSGPIFACDWHPDQQSLATASRDKTIKVWDMTGKPALESTIHTLAPIGHIKWRPQRKYHIASCALVVDSSVNVWDVRRPYIPFAAFDDHKDVATGIAWRGSPHVFLSTSRDCKLIQHSFADAKRPLDAANPQGISISGKGDILLATRPELPINMPESEMFLLATSSLQTFTRRDSHEVDAFVECAKKYILTGRPLPELCDVNAVVARSVGRNHVAILWEVIRTIFSYPTNGVDEMGITLRSDDLLLPEGKASKVVSSCDASEEKSLRGLDTSVLEEVEEVEEFDFSQVHRPEVQAQGDFFFGDGEPDPLSVDLLETAPRFQPDWTLKTEAFVTRHEILEGAPPEPYNEALEPPPTTETAATAITVHALPTIPTPRFGDLVVKALRHHVDLGDVQTAVAVLAVLGDRRKDIDLPKTVQEHWLLSYLDILGRHQLFAQAAEFIKIAWLETVSQLSQQSTTIYTTCGACNKPLTRSGWLCDRCKSTPSCALCHQVVRGLQAWCQGCGHGGHVSHIISWFRTKDQCPTGCGHLCEYS